MSDVKKYFNQLNYTSTNEDTILELDVMRSDEKCVLSVAGSGARAIPLISKTKSKIIFADYSQSQIELTKLRLQTIKELNFNDFLSFWGYPCNPIENEIKKRTEIFQHLSLSDETRQHLSPIFEHHHFTAPLYYGNWEKTMKKMGQIIQKIIGHPLSSKDKDRLRFKLAIFFVFQKTYFNSALYKGKFPKVNLDKSYFRYHFNLFHGLLCKYDVSNNYLLEIVFNGAMKNTSSLPAEATEHIFIATKKNLPNIQLEFLTGNLFEKDLTNQNISFVSLSDIPSYFDRDLGQSFLQKLSPSLEKKARIVSRYYCYRPPEINTHNFYSITKNFSKHIENERTRIYYYDIWEKD